MISVLMKEDSVNMHRDEIEGFVFQILKNEMSISERKLSKFRNTRSFADLRTDPDDWSFTFIPLLENGLSFDARAEEWARIETLDDLVELVNRCLSS